MPKKRKCNQTKKQSRKRYNMKNKTHRKMAKRVKRKNRTQNRRRGGAMLPILAGVGLASGAALAY